MTVDTGQTTIVVQRYLDDLDRAERDGPDELLVRQLIGRAANRLRLLSGRLLNQSYPRLRDGPCNLRVDEVLSGVVERLIKAMRSVRPRTVRQFFALANQHMRWELNEIARRFDNRTRTLELLESAALPPCTAEPESDGLLLPRILAAFDRLPGPEREAFELVRLQGMSCAEAAEVIGVVERTVHRRVKRGLVLLTQLLADLAPAVDPQKKIEQSHP
jgi:RNA polymerase sigma factor (sigma-70 family)